MTASRGKRKGQRQGKGKANQGSGVIQAIAKADRDVRHLTQGFIVVVSKMHAVSELWNTAGGIEEVKERLPGLKISQLRGAFNQREGGNHGHGPSFCCP